jgi:hypothetical protein
LVSRALPRGGASGRAEWRSTSLGSVYADLPILHDVRGLPRVLEEMLQLYG